MKIQVKDLGLVGLIADQAGHELPPNAFTALQNMRMRAGWAERVGGYGQVFADTSVVPYMVMPHSSATVNYLVHCGVAKIYVDDGTTRTEITGTAPTGGTDNRWTGGTIGGLLVLSNGVDVPMYWDNNTANNLATLTGWNSNHRCKSLRVFKNFLIALAPTKTSVLYPHTVMWSDSAEPGALPQEWATTDTNDAGESPALAETPDAIVDGLALGDTFVIYKERSMYGMQLIGGNDIFRFWRLPGEVGAIGPGCIAMTPVGHVVLGSGDIVVHNGQGPRSIVDQKTRERVFADLDPAECRRAFVVAHPAREEVWICYPRSGQTSCSRAVVWNWKDDVISERDLPSVTYGCSGVVSAGGADTWTTAASAGTLWSAGSGGWSTETNSGLNKARLFMSAAASKIYEMDEIYDAAGASITGYIERTGLHLDTPEQIKLVRSVWPRIDAIAGVTVTVEVGASMDAATSPTWSAAQTFTVGTSQKVDTFATGRYLSYRVTGVGTNRWRVRGIDFDIVPQGAW